MKFLLYHRSHKHINQHHPVPRGFENGTNKRYKVKSDGDAAKRVKATAK